MPTPLACIMLMSQTEIDRQVLTSLSQPRITTPPNLGEATGPVIALVDFLTNLPATLDTFVHSAMARYCGVRMGKALPPILPGLSGFHMTELSNPAYKWLLILDDRYKHAQSQGLNGESALNDALEKMTCPTE